MRIHVVYYINGRFCNRYSNSALLVRSRRNGVIEIYPFSTARRSVFSSVPAGENEPEYLTIPSKLKIYEMVSTIRENEKADVIVIAKEVVSEILKPTKTGKKLAQKEEIVVAAKKKSDERLLDMFKKLTK